MPTVPQFSQQYSPNGTPLPYQHLQTDESMFGGLQAKALEKAAEGMGKLAEVSLNIQKTIDDTKAVEFNNAVEKWKQDNLLDKENGYYNKTGKDASGQTDALMKSYDDFVDEWRNNNKVSRKMAATINNVAMTKRTTINEGVLSHDNKETSNWAKSEGDLAIQNAVTSAVSERNNPDNIKISVGNAIATAQWQASVLHLDEASTKDLIADYKSKIYSGVLDAKLQEGNLDAKQFFEEHKADIDSKLHSNYIGAIKREEDKYVIRDTAQKLLYESGGNVQAAVEKAQKIKDVNISDGVVSKLLQQDHQDKYFHDKQQQDLMNQFNQSYYNAMQNGTYMSFDQIPAGLDPEYKISCMNIINKNGQPETDNQIWEMLYDKEVNDAQGFAKEDLNKYRGFLSDGEYKSLLKKQQDIKAGNYYSTIKDDNKMINQALKTMGLNHGNRWFDGSGDLKDTAFSEVRSMVREYEARKGRKISDAELQNITNSLGFKDKNGVAIYKQLEKGMNERVNFTRDVINDFAYFQKTHDGKLPSDEEKLKIINNRLNNHVQARKTQAQQTVANYTYAAGTLRNIQSVKAKPHEQQVLTYFADRQIPTVAKQLGIKLTVTDRYRNQAGSHHAEGRAADVSMSEHNVQSRIKIYDKLLSLPTVQAIGTSDPNILAHFAGNRKIVDERKYDRQHGTNHVNHAHVTLINLNSQSTKVAAKNGVYKL